MSCNHSDHELDEFIMSRINHVDIKEMTEDEYRELVEELSSEFYAQRKGDEMVDLEDLMFEVLKKSRKLKMGWTRKVEELIEDLQSKYTED